MRWNRASFCRIRWWWAASFGPISRSIFSSASLVSALGQIEEHAGDAVEQPPAAFQPLDGVAEGRRLGLRHDRRDVGVVLGEGALEGRQEVLRRNARRTAAFRTRPVQVSKKGLGSAAGVVGWFCWVMPDIWWACPAQGKPKLMPGPVPNPEKTMPRHASYVPHGVIPAVLLPFHDDLSIDEASFRSHLRDVAATEGISAITINAHSTEVASCTFDEQRRVLDDRAGRDRRPAADRQRHLGRRQRSRPRASPAWRPTAAPRRCWCSRRRRSRCSSRRRWRSPISSASPTPPTCRSSCSSIRWRPARATRATRC